VRPEAAQEDEGTGPSEPVYRSRLQTTLSCFPQRREVVSVKEKIWQRTMSGEVQGDERKRTTDEVSKTSTSDVETGRPTLLQDKPRGEPVYCLGGVRHRGGGSSRQGRNPAGESPVLLIARFKQVVIPQIRRGNPLVGAWCKRPGCHVIGRLQW